eukprot:TRINITY_DN5230_c0_g3_i2.p1 TRINITY_DN5230_c0_g3~~TRINITY_DN5230_c0_g3_i2.p1  ORF type:complete len:2515 (+),score=751.31 TRINITY_DN5230_c0_g3_i2:85-7629(+)
MRLVSGRRRAVAACACLLLSARSVGAQCNLPADCSNPSAPAAVNTATCLEGLQPTTRSLQNQPITSVLDDGTATTVTSTVGTTCALGGTTTVTTGFSVCEFTPVPGYQCTYVGTTTTFVNGASVYFVCANDNTVSAANPRWYNAAGEAGANSIDCASGSVLNTAGSGACVPTCVPVACAPFTLSTYNMQVGDTNPGPACTAGASTLCAIDSSALGYIPTNGCTDQCAISCADGYHDPSGGTVSIGKGWLQCNNPATAGTTAAVPTITCVANQCAPFTLPSGTVGWGVVPCPAGSITLSTDPLSGTPNECELQCADGYGDDGAGGLLPAQSVTCPPGANPGASPVSVVNGVASTSLQGAALGCAENSCAPFALNSSTQCINSNVECLRASSASNACAVTASAAGDYIELKTVTRNTCTLDCAVGYVKQSSAAVLTLTCPLTAVNGQTAVTPTPVGWQCWATCQVWLTQNTCASPRSVPISNADTTTCPGGDLTQCSSVQCCLADCAVDVSAQVGGVNVSSMQPTACAPGGSVPHGTTCTWVVKRGYVCAAGTLTQTCNNGASIVQLSSCSPTCASFTCDTSLPEVPKSSVSDPNTIVCTGASQCTTAQCCDSGCRVPQFGVANTADISYTGGVTVPPLTVSAACGDGLQANYYVNHSTTCTFTAITNAKCTNAGSSTCTDGTWVGAWSYTSLPTCVPFCGVENASTNLASPPGLVECTAPFTRKANAGTIACPSGICDDATCCNADCPTQYVPGSWLLGVGCPNAMATSYGSGTQPVYHNTTCTWKAWDDWTCNFGGAITCKNGQWYLQGTTTLATLPTCDPLCSGHNCLGLLVSIDNPSATVCSSGSCTDNLCCLEPCTVQDSPTYAGQPMATVSPATCVPGQQVPDGTECTWVARTGHSCSNAGKSVCNNQIWSLNLVTCLPTCAVHNCAPTPATLPARDPILKVAAGSITCPTGNCTQSLCCDAPCTVQSLPLDQTYVATTASDVTQTRVPMITLDSQCSALLDANYNGLPSAAVSGTVCTWAPVQGYECAGIGTTTCSDGVWSQSLPVCVPMCASYQCGTSGSAAKTKAANCPNCLLKADQATRSCASGACDDNNCCDAACDTPAEPTTMQGTTTVYHVKLVSPCVASQTASIKHGQMCTWDVQEGYSCDDAAPYICNDGSQATVPQCYATCLNPGTGWGNAACSKSAGFIPKNQQGQIRCGRDMALPGDACTEDICCDFSCSHPAFECPVGSIAKTGQANIRCGPTLSTCTSELCCEAATCPANAGPPGVCECNTGYGAFPSVSWNPTSGAWTHKCYSMCNHPSGPCTSPSLVVKGPLVPMCNGANPATDCPVDVCCDVSCANAGFTSCSGTRGLMIRDNASAIACGRTTALCTVAACCWSTCDSPDFNGCSMTSAATGWLLKPTAPQIRCSGSSGLTCTVAGCCDATICANYVCSAGMSKKAGAASLTCNNAACTDAICCIENTCAAPATVVNAGVPSPFDQCYAFADGTGACTTVATCTPASCKPGCTGTPTISCAIDGGAFTITGCRLNQCTPPGGDYPGYTFAGGGTACNTVSVCGTVNCAAGFHFEIPSFPDRHAKDLQVDRSYTSPTCFCDTDGGKFLCLGCQENQCTPPVEVLFGYNFLGDRATCTRASSCRIHSCRDGYLRTGDPLELSCPTHGGNFQAKGCAAVPCPQWARTTAAGVCQCQAGYRYVADNGVQQPVWTGSQWLHRCERVNCPAFAETTADSVCRCRQGYMGVPNWDGAGGVWTHSCSPVSCPANALRVCDGFGVCNCQCADGYVSNVTAGTSWDFATQRWIVGCNSVCPRGFTYDESKATWDGQRWTYTCVEARCPERASRVAIGDGSVTCQCDAPWEGVPLWNPSLLRWDHTCGPPRTAVGCPSGSGPSGVCECLDGHRYAGTSGPIWNGTHWTHSCTRVACPLNSAWGVVQPGNYQACVCNPGFAGTPVWSITRFVWTHTCVPVGNLPPTATVPTSAVNAPVGAPQTLTGFITGVSAPEVGQGLNTPQCTNTNPSMFSSQPTLSLDSAQSTATLSFNAQAAGTAVVTCSITDQGTPALSTTMNPFTIVTTGVVTPPPATTVCTNNQCAVAFTPVVIQADRNAANTFVQDNYLNLVRQAGRTVQCVPDNRGLLSVTEIDVTGRLRIIPVQGQFGSTTVRCNILDNLVQRAAVNFLVNVVESTNVPVPTTVPGQVYWQRLRLQLNRPFTRTNFGNAIKSLSSRPLRDVRVWYVCPVNACPNAVCPTTLQARRNAGCLMEDEIPLGRAAAPLQLNTNDQVYVDFQSFAFDETIADALVQQQGITDLAAAVNSCTAGTACQLSNVGSQWANPVLTPAVTERIPITPTPGSGRGAVDSSDDSSISTGALVGLIVGGILLCCLLLLILFLLMRKKPKKDKRRDGFDEVKKGEEMDSSSGDMGYSRQPLDPSYARTSPQQEYGGGARSYPPDAYPAAGGYGEFFPDESVRALYEGEYHEGTIWTKDADGTYTIKWADGSHTTGVPPEHVISTGAHG